MNSEGEELDPLTPKQEKLRLKYQGMYTGLGGLSFGFSPYTGIVLMQSASARSEELIRWARHNPFLYKWLERFADSSDTVNFIAGHGLMLWAIIANTGRLRGNAALFSMAGLTKEQVMAPPPGMPEMSQKEMDAYSEIYATANGHRGT